MQKNNKAGGLKAKHNGTHFEMAIERSCGYYKQMGIAHIQKTPEPMKQIATINARLGHFKAHYVKKAQHPPRSVQGPYRKELDHMDAESFREAMDHGDDTQGF